MAFGFSLGDFVLLTQLAQKTIHNGQKACGARDELVREVKSLHIALRRVKAEVSDPASILNRTQDNRRFELGSLARPCRSVLRVLSGILEKYNALSEQERCAKKGWKQIRFGNGEMQDLDHIRSELATHAQAFNMFPNLLSIGSQEKVEEYMDLQGQDLREIKMTLNWLIASMRADRHKETSILTIYTEDDKGIWKAFRRELIKEGFSHRTLSKHKRTIKRYVLELGEKGALDDPAHDMDSNYFGTSSDSNIEEEPQEFRSP